MRIEELVLEGFKSYPERTQITGWDPSFNAITGLNGSGKSNILDAIAFVLGLTNMSTMRAQHQADLVYKKGQAGITKASVTIVFDNSERDKSPVGYEDWKQITVTRQFALPNNSKYLVNGHRSQQQAVQSLFQSVQLNINNPNFVIMQGKITKVLNMRAPEILGMVEEAAGTRMFEERKDKARKTMAKKDKRVQEITSILGEEIMPKLDKLREEKRTYLEFQKAEQEKERLEQTLLAWRWYDASNRIVDSARQVDEGKAEIEEQKEQKKVDLDEIKTAEKNVERVTKARDNEAKKGGKLNKLQEQAAELDKELVKVRTQVEIKEKDIKDEEDQVASSEADIKNTEAACTEKEKEANKMNKSFDTLKSENTSLKDKLDSDEELLQTLQTGLSSKNANAGGGGGYMGQLQAARTRQAQGKAEEEQHKKKLSMAENELRETEARWKKVEKDAGEGKKRLDVLQGVVDECRKKLSSCGWDSQKEQDGETKIQDLRNEVEALSSRKDAVRRGLGNMDFDYPPLGPHFDPRKVKGRLGTLVSLQKENYGYATALEVTAGGKLYQVVVSDEQVGKELLKSGLKSRVTLIPLNKIRPFEVSPQKLNAVSKSVGERARLALDLVGYEPELAKAMSYTFGSTIVCDNPETAKKVTFDRNIGLRSVTVDGDSYDPSGTLSGGAKAQSEDILIKVQHLIEAELNLADAKSRLKEAEAAWTSDKTKKKRDEWKRLDHDLKIKEHELQLLQDQLGESNAAKLKKSVEELREKIEQLNEDVAAAQKKQRDAEAECKQLERDMEEFKTNKDGKIDDLKKSISSQKAAFQKHNVTLKTKQKEVQTVNLELDQLKGDLETAQLQIEEMNSGIAKLRDDLAKLKRQVVAKEKEHQEARAKLEEEERHLHQFNEQIQSLQQEIKDKKAAVEQADESIASLQQKIEACRKAAEHAKNEKKKLEEANPFIVQDKAQFGKQGTKYHFASMNIPDLQQKALELEETVRAKKKKVNAKSANMLDDLEKRETSTKKMLSTVVKDKEKIEATIDELDREKRDTLQSTFEKVDKDFGQIFAELLPGNFAKLQPPDGQDLMDGLEVKVRLGSVWKQSLTELSGGQRSLIALSLIMALLQFKPAPMYILDEIDAALDLQHTQNIGHLFRTRFKGSQFIVVSLKEGLFTNANVLFRTQFRNGTSVVERTANRSSSTLYEGRAR
ncbi:Structural maintenance of chromosomes protein 2 [Marasmius sp. AFHP31]|nr:Structural maintenance of chromosomes protein 2 [Marasmius sp. AFHP31]